MRRHSRYVDARSVVFDEGKFIRELKHNELTNENVADMGESNLGEQKVDLGEEAELKQGEKVGNEISTMKPSKHERKHSIEVEILVERNGNERKIEKKSIENETKMRQAKEIAKERITEVYSHAGMAGTGGNEEIGEYYRPGVEKEFKSLSELGVFSEPIAETHMEKVMDTRLILSEKNLPDGTTMPKARLVCKGYQQEIDPDINLYSPVSHTESFRLFMALAAEEKSKIEQLDFNTAFLQADLPPDKQFLVRIPQNTPKYILDTYSWNPGAVLRARKPLYGSAEAPRIWYEDVSKYFKIECQLQPTLKDPCFFIGGNNMKVLIHVDDVLVSSKCEGELAEFKHQLKARYSIKELGAPQRVLGYEVLRLGEGIGLVQSDYVRKILCRFSAHKNAKAQSPFPLNLDLAHPESPEKSEKITGDSNIRELNYREIVGSLLYLASRTRPDIAFYVSYLAKFSSDPTEFHWKLTEHLLGYLQNTERWGLWYKYGGESEPTICRWSDADWGQNDKERKCTTGYIFKLNESTIAWMSKKQKKVALSTMEAEAYALVEATKEATFLKHILEDLNYSQGTMNIYCDNEATISVATNPTALHGRSKHVDRPVCYLKDEIATNGVRVQYIRSAENAADIFTKPLSGKVFRKCRELLGMKEFGEDL